MALALVIFCLITITGLLYSIAAPSLPHLFQWQEPTSSATTQNHTSYVISL